MCADTIALLLTYIKVIRDLQVISVGQRAELRRDQRARNYRRDLNIPLQDTEMTLKSNILLS